MLKIGRRVRWAIPWAACMFTLTVSQLPLAAPVTLEYWSWDQSIRTLEVNEVAKPFQEANPGVTVNVTTEPWSGYWNKLTVLNAAGTPPDVYNMSLAYLCGPATVVSAYTNGNVGYIPTADAYAIGGYEVDDAHKYCGYPGTTERGTAEKMVELVTHLGSSA